MSSHRETRRPLRMIAIIVGVLVLLATALVTAALRMTAGPAEAADALITDLREQRLDAAYLRATAGFRDATDRAAFDHWIAAHGLSQVASIRWHARRVSGSRGWLRGAATIRDGRIVPLSLGFRQDAEGNWRLHWMHAADEDDPLPDAHERLELVRRAMLDFGTSVNAASMAHFHRQLSSTWRAQQDVATLDRIFGDLYGRGLDFTALAAAVPALDAPLRADEHGVAVQRGHYPLGHARLDFELKFVSEGIGWRLFGFAYDLQRLP